MITSNIRRVLCRALFAVSLATGAAAAADYGDGNYAANHISLEAAVKVWREAAWQNGDFLSQVKLGDVYSNSSDSRYYDPVEAYVWYYLAGKNRMGRARMWDEDAADVIRTRHAHAIDKQQEILLELSSAQRTEARDRITYILSCSGADGFLALGRISETRPRSDDSEDDDYDRRGDRHGYGNGSSYAGGDRSSGPAASVMAPNDADALVYFHTADAMGNPLGRGYLNSLEGALRGSYAGGRLVEKLSKGFHYWFPPFEFYPAGTSAGGVPLSDECVPTMERERALAMAGAVPADAVRHALYFLGWKGPRAVALYQASIPDQSTGLLTAVQLVRAIQSAAVDGDAVSQNTLGVMYAKGLGVVTNYARAEYWFLRAADQRFPAALYHLGVLYKVGPPGVDQDLHKSNDYMTNSAIAGFRPTMNQLGSLLNAAANEPPRPGQN
ncbi:MAG TPA: tetratricopeptide repeat protein [Rhizomicrobium sp.]|nr:tetratricopeptide repeat protein [Rhizomicrobium sp.]